MRRRAFGLRPVPSLPSQPFGFNPSRLRAYGAARCACLRGKPCGLSPPRDAWRPSIPPNRLRRIGQASAPPRWTGRWRARRGLLRQVVRIGKGLGDLGFGCEVKQAMQQRADFLAEQGLAERRMQRVILTRNLLGTLRNRELAQAAKDIAAETGLEHRSVGDGQRVAGIYRRSVMLASGRYAMLDDGMGFSLVPWKPVIEQRLGQQLAATVRSSGVSWEIERHPKLSLS